MSESSAYSLIVVRAVKAWGADHWWSLSGSPEDARGLGVEGLLEPSGGNVLHLFLFWCMSPPPPASRVAFARAQKEEGRAPRAVCPRLL